MQEICSDYTQASSLVDIVTYFQLRQKKGNNQHPEHTLESKLSGSKPIEVVSLTKKNFSQL